MVCCCVEGCDRPGAFRTRTRPTWCDQHLRDVYERGGLELLEEFTKPGEYLLTRCLRCGFEGHYRFEYVLDRIDAAEFVCRACYWRAWAQGTGEPTPGEDQQSIRDLAQQVAEEHGFTYLRPLSDPILKDGPHATQCNRCGRIEAQRIGDIAWGCACSRNQKSSQRSARRDVTKPRLFRTSGSEAVTWWDHERNDEKLWQTARPRGRQVVGWVCPKGHRFTEQISRMADWPHCPVCSAIAKKEREETYQAWVDEHRHHAVADIPELLRAWADETPPDQVPAVGKYRYRRFKFRCANGHRYDCEPADWKTSTCPYCRGLETKRRNREAAKVAPNRSRLTPELTSQWHHERNAKLTLASISLASKRLVWWKDPVCGHEFQAVVRDRDKYQRYRCPICHTVLDSLAYQYPELAQEWAPENSLTPWHIRPFASNLAQIPTWICSQNPEHRWQAMPASRINGSGCPQCRTSGKSSVELRYFEAARKRWKKVSSGQRIHSDSFTGHSSWQVDILITLSGHQVVVEYDGAYWHQDKRSIDSTKTEDLLREGLSVCRVREHPLTSLGIIHPHYLEVTAYPAAQDPEHDLDLISEWLERLP